MTLSSSVLKHEKHLFHFIYNLNLIKYSQVTTVAPKEVCNHCKRARMYLNIDLPSLTSDHIYLKALEGNPSLPAFLAFLYFC